MNYDYILTLKKERRRSINVISILLLLISIVAFLTVSVKSGNKLILFATVSLILIIGLFSAYFRSKKKVNVTFNVLLLIAGATWFAMPFTQWVGITLLLLALLEAPARKPVVISFSSDGIIIKNFFSKAFSWQSFNNVLLKDDLLTLDFQNNRIIQKELCIQQTAPDENEFNAYCMKQLAHHLRKVDDTGHNP